jgi:hypothetical protein
MLKRGSLLVEFSQFMKLAEKASWTSKGRIALKARKQSINMRRLLKEFRKYSLANEHAMKDVDIEE